jgi:hypothetical protein
MEENSSENISISEEKVYVYTDLYAAKSKEADISSLNESPSRKNKYSSLCTV